MLELRLKHLLEYMIPRSSHSNIESTRQARQELAIRSFRFWSSSDSWLPSAPELCQFLLGILTVPMVLRSTKTENSNNRPDAQVYTALKGAFICISHSGAFGMLERVDGLAPNAGFGDCKNKLCQQHQAATIFIKALRFAAWHAW